MHHDHKDCDLENCSLLKQLRAQNEEADMICHNHRQDGCDDEF